MPKSKLLHQYWYECYRCGITYPERDIQTNAYNQKICKFCWDDNENDTRKKATGTGPARS